MKFLKRRWFLYINRVILVGVMGLLFGHAIVKKLPSFKQINDSVFLLSCVFIIYLVLVFLSAKPMRAVVRRCKANYELTELTLSPLEYIVVFMIGTLVYVLYNVSPLVHPSRLILFSTPLVLWLLYLAYGNTVLDQPHKDKAQERSEEPFFRDSPISSFSEDILNRLSFVTTLCEQILSYPSDDAFVFGLYGKWGSGKTSTLNLIKKKFENNSNVIVIEFDPWYFVHREAMIKGFYSTLSTALEKRYYIPNMRNEIKQYQTILISGLKFAGFDLSGLSSQKQISIAEMKNQIDKNIGLTGKRLIFLVDDIDRVTESKDLLEILKIVKLSGSFKHVIFILSFDPKVLTDLLRDIGGDSFLEKVIQYPIVLPEVEPLRLKEFLLHALSSLLSRIEIPTERSKSTNEGFEESYHSHLNRIFINLRVIKRFMNALIATLPAIKSEVHLLDFIHLQILRVFFYDVYIDIWNNPQVYLPYSWDSPFLFWSVDFISSKEKENLVTKEHIENLLLRDIGNREIVLYLLKTLFFIKVNNAFEGIKSELSNHQRIEKRLTHPEIFPRYFLLTTRRSEIPHNILEQTIAEWNLLPHQANFDKVFSDFKNEGKFRAFLEELKNFREKLNPIAAVELIKWMGSNSEIFSREIVGLSSEYTKTKVIILLVLDEIIDPIRHQKLLEEIIEKTPSIMLAMQLVYSCDPKSRDLPNLASSVNQKDLLKVAIGRLQQELLENDEDIFMKEPLFFGHVLNTLASYSDEMKKKMNDYLFKLMDTKPHYFHQLTEWFVREFHLDYENLVKTVDENRLYNELLKYRTSPAIYNAEQLGSALYVQTYERRQAEAEAKLSNEADRQTFANNRNQGDLFFQSANYPKALESYDKALSSSENVYPADRDYVNYKRWRTLVEIAWNGGDEPVKLRYLQASQIAETESQIQVLISNAYGKRESPDPGLDHTGYCMFYLIRLRYSSNEDKPQFRDLLQTHYSLALPFSDVSQYVQNRMAVLKVQIEKLQS